MVEMLTYRVVKEPYGWAVRLPDRRMTPFRSQRRAADHAQALAEARRAGGGDAEVVVEAVWPSDSPAWRRSSRRPQLHWLVARPSAWGAAIGA